MRPFKMLLLLGTTLTLASCETPKASVSPTVTAATDACVVFRPILFSRKLDTKETIEQVKAHNDAYDALCKRTTP